MEVDMNTDLISIQKNRRYILYNDNQHHSHKKNQSFPETGFKNPKIEHYLRVLTECGIHQSVIEHMSVFFLYLTRRNRRITTIVQYHNAIKRLMLFLKPLNIKRIEMVTPQGAHASAAIYSLIETAKASGLDPYWYLKYLFKHLPEAMTVDEFKALLPHKVNKILLDSPAT